MEAQMKAAQSQYDMAVNGARREDKLAAAAQVGRAKGAVQEVNSYIHETVQIAQMEGEVMDIYPDPKPPYTSVASTVKNLERKGYLKSTAKGVSYLYSIKISKDKYRSKFMQSWVKDYFHDSYRQMVSFFAKEQAISAEDLREILKEIEKGKM
jgi:predicted transcriptional regulator